LANSSYPSNLKLLTSAIAKILLGTPKFWGAPLAQGQTHFSSGCDFMTGLGKAKLCAKFEIASFSFSRCRNIKRQHPNFGELPYSRATPTSLLWDLMMGLGEPQLNAKFKIAEFIYHGNIRKFVLKRQIRFLSNLLGKLG